MNKSRKPRGETRIKGSPPNWLICAEGESEIYYLKGLVEHLSKGKKHGIHFGNKSMCDKSIRGACARQHDSLYEKVEECSAGINYEKIWILSDYDAFGEGGKQRENSFKNMLNLSDNGFINTAWSLPKFEYYLALHNDNYILTLVDNVYKKNIKELVDKAIIKQIKCSKNCAVRSCSKANRIICNDAKEKPYCNSFVSMGGIDACEKALDFAKKSYDDNQSNIIEYKFKNCTACTNMYELIDDLKDYFEKYII